MSPAGGGLRGWKKLKTMKPASKANNFHYNKKLQPYANSLRKQMTKAEACLWKYALRNKMLKEYQFRRQRPVLNFIADFMSSELMLIIEVDGYTHTFEETIKKDLKKTKMLENIGFTVMRFTDDDVLNDIENVKRKIEAFVEKVEEGIPPP